jgi:predicted secreted protein
MFLSYIVAFTCIWWVVFYMSLPFGVEKITPSKRGFDHGAPKRPHIGIKMLITTLMALLLTYGFVYIAEEGYLAKFVRLYLELFQIIV